MRGPDREPRSPLLHPVAIAALVLLVVNDHVLKAAWPGLLTGKASDVAALVLVPPLVVELGRLLTGGRLTSVTRTRLAWAAAIGIAAVFLAVKLDPGANAAYAVGLGLLQWPAHFVGSLFGGLPVAGPRPAPTVLDAGDLVTLPAAILGGWIAAGRPLRRPGVGARSLRALPTPIRLGALLATAFALAATSSSPPNVVTGVAQDEVTIAPGDPPVVRRLRVQFPSIYQYTPSPAPDAAPAPTEIAGLEARGRWPLVQPPPRFVVSVVEGHDLVATNRGASVSLVPGACAQGCSLVFDVAIDWPDGGGAPRSSIAWELAATIRAPQAGSISGSVSVIGDGLTRPGQGSFVGALLVLGIVPLAAIVVGDRRRRSAERGRTGARTLGDWATIAAASGLIAFLALVPFGVPGRALEPAAGGVGEFILFVGRCVAVGLVAALVVLWHGSGDGLAVLAAGGTLAGLLFGARLIDAASMTFAERGVQLAIVVTVVAAVTIAGAVARPGLPDPPTVTEDGRVPDAPGAGRLIVAAILVALVLGLIPGAPLAALVMAGGLTAWWSTGRGHLLALAALVVGGMLVFFLLMQGPTLFGFVRWTPIETASMYLGGLACLVALGAAFGGYALSPDRPWGTGKPPPTDGSLEPPRI